MEFGEDYRYDEIIAGDFNVPSECVRSKKRLLGMTSIFVFIFVMKYCISHIMILFLDLKKYFYPHFYESDGNPNKLFVYLNTYV